MKVRLRALAERDIEAIHNYIHERNPEAALNVVRALYAGMQYISEFPYAAEETDDPTVRVKLVRKYQYKMFYSITGEQIEILHIRRTSQKPWDNPEQK